MDRIFSAQIAYPFTAVDKTEPWTTALRDLLFYVSPADALVDAGSLISPLPAGMGPVGAWLAQVQDLGGGTVQYDFHVRIPLDDDYIDTTVDILGHDGYGYVTRSFTVDTVALSGQIHTARDIVDNRSAMVIDCTGLPTPSGTINYTADHVVEPALVVPCRRRVVGIEFYNEYRAKDPADRSTLPPDELKESYNEGSTVVLNDGYNCAVSYDANAQILRITGGIGLGKGQPATNEWDDDTGSDVRGIRTINGVNQNGVVEIEGGSSVILIGSEGDLEIRLRDEGDDV